MSQFRMEMIKIFQDLNTQLGASVIIIYKSATIHLTFI